MALSSEELSLQSDTKYRQYGTAMDKALRNFESTSEWADLISALGKLNKVMSAHIKFPVIPRRILIGKRLAQCMHPALPSGVHLRALECYDVMFKCMGTNRLSRELFIYSSGLFPLFGNASMTVRPQLLSIYETHFVPLGCRLRPALCGFLNGLLPGLDEGSDYFDRTAALIQRVSEAAGDDFFYGCLWECVLSNPSIRLPSVVYVMMRLDKRRSMEDQLYVMGTCVETMVRAVCAALRDSSVLVQRFTLDLLLAAFPMHCDQLTRADKVRLVTAALTVLLRRDMSLNRRLYSWLLGAEVDVLCLPIDNPLRQKAEATPDRRASVADEPNEEYFDMYSRQPVIEALTNCLRDCSQSTTSDVRAYRILVSLLDKLEIGPVVLDYVMIEVLRAMYCNHSSSASRGAAASPVSGAASPSSTSCSDATSKQQQDLVKAANLLFAALEPHYVWEYMQARYGEACRRVEKPTGDRPMKSAKKQQKTATELVTVGGGDPSVAECCLLIEFLLDVASIETCLDVQTVYLPELVSCVLQSLCVTLSERDVGRLCPTEFACSLQMCRAVLNRAQPSSAALRRCSVHFSRLFAGLVRCRLLADGSQVDSVADLLVCSRLSVAHRDSSLIDLLHYRVTTTVSSRHRKQQFTSAVAGNAPMCPPRSDQQVIDDQLSVAENRIFALKSDAELYLPVFRSSCQLLVLLSSFPSGEGDDVPEDDTVMTAAMSCLPEWLAALLSVGCFVPAESSPPEFHFTACSVLLDLVALVCSGGGSVRPMLTPLLYRRLIDDTLTVQLLTRRLWRLLSASCPTLHLAAVGQLQLLLNLTPAQLVETQLAAGMTCGSLRQRAEAFGRFSVLWHLSREVSARRHAGSASFDRCLLLMLDCLRDPSAPLHATARTWLTHTLQRGDVARILEPLLLMLLHPSTARVSVRHARVSNASVSQLQLAETPTDGASSDDEATRRVYAISCERGNVIYHHVTSAGRQTVTTTAVLSSSSQTDSGVNSSGTQGLSASSQGRSKSSVRSALAGPLQLFVNPVLAASMNERRPKADALSSGRRPSIESATDSVSSAAPLSRCTSSGTIPRGRSIASDSLLTLDLARRPSTESTELRGDMEDSSGSLFGLDYRSTSVWREESVLVASGLVSQLVEAALDLCCPSDEGGDRSDGAKPSTAARDDLQPVHPLHGFMLLYCQVCDSQRVLYALQTLRTVLETDCRLALCSLATSRVNEQGGGGVAGSSGSGTAAVGTASRCHQIQTLLACHRRSLEGHNFSDQLLPEALTAYRSSMLLEVVLQICVEFVCSYYPSLGANPSVSADQLQANRQVQVVATEIMTSMFSELVTVVRSSGRGFATYLADLLRRCKVQKTMLNCLLSTVHSLDVDSPTAGHAFTEDVLRFNEGGAGVAGGGWSTADDVPGGSASLSFTETLQVQLIRLILALIILEDQTNLLRQDTAADAVNAGSRVTFTPQPHLTRYLPDQPLPAQPMFLQAMLRAVRQPHTRHLHRHWLWLFTSALPFVRRPLPHLVISVATQLVQNAEDLAGLYRRAADGGTGAVCAPPDHMVYLLESLTVLCHYCMVDGAHQTPGAAVPTSAAHAAMQTYAPGSSAAQVLANLAHAFVPPPPEAGTAADVGESLLNARRLLLANLHRICAGLANVWEAASDAATLHEAWCWVLGVPRVVRQQIVELLSPLAQHHAQPLVSAMAQVWWERRERGRRRQAVSEPCPAQLVLVELLASVRVITVDSLVQTVRVVVKQQSSSASVGVKMSLSSPALSLLMCYLRGVSAQQLLDSWPSLLQLLREGSQLSPPALFVLLATVSEFAQRVSPLMERKDVRDLQDANSRIVEACSTVAGACLEPTTWLRRNLAVRTAPELSPDDPCGEDQTDKLSNPVPAASDVQWSVHALRVLAMLLAPLLDVLYQSDEKERVLPLLSGVMYRVTPYLRHHGASNAPAFLACSRLLAALSEYQYSRRAWRREAFDLLLDPAFFSMDARCLPFWRTAVDNLMTHDRTTFKELLARSPVPQTSSLNLFSSRDAELEQRCHLLKRLAFVVYCSDEDQYQPYLPDIQEKLAENLRLPQSAPGVQAAVMLCSRVILLRMSPPHLVSLWPSIITEMIQALLTAERIMEAECGNNSKLGSDAADGGAALAAGIDTTDAAAALNGLTAEAAGWLQLQLEVCKLLDLCLTLPAQRLPQFQMYRWAFVGGGAGSAASANSSLDAAGSPSAVSAASAASAGSELRTPALAPRQFVPYMGRLGALAGRLSHRHQSPKSMEAAAASPRPLIRSSSISRLSQLYPFFRRLGCGPLAMTDVSLPESQAIAAVEHVLENDFLEPLQPTV